LLGKQKYKPKIDVRKILYRLLLLVILGLIFLWFVDQHNQMYYIKAHTDDLQKEIHSLQTQLEESRMYNEGTALQLDTRISILEAKSQYQMENNSTGYTVTYQQQPQAIHNEEIEQQYESTLPEVTLWSSILIMGGQLLRMIKVPILP
jgi:ABC-type transporter MlaC component